MKQFLLKTPFYRILLAFIVGILLFHYGKLSDAILPFFLLGACFIALHFYFQYKKQDQYKFRWLFGSGILVLLIACGLLATSMQAERNRFTNLNKQGFFEVELIDVPQSKAKSYAVKVKTLRFAADSLHFKTTQGNAVLYLQKEDKIRSLGIGDRLLICSELKAPKKRHNPEEFDYAKYLERKGFGATAYVDSQHWKLLNRNSSFSIRQTAKDIQNKLLKVYQSQQIKGSEFAVLGALTLGYQEEIDEQLYQSYSNSGAMHILSVSGLHVGIIYLVFAFLLGFMDKKKQTRILKAILIITFLWVYAFITGLSPAVMRAALMFSMLALASALNYKSYIYNTVFFSAFILLLYNPNFIFDIGFLLSYIAVISIVFFQPHFKQILTFNNKVLSWSWDLFCVSIAAQIGTFPLVLLYFQKFSTHFLLTNLIAIPLSTGIIYLAMLLFAVSPISWLANGVGVALNFLLKAQNSSIIFIDKLPFSTFEIWISKAETILLYAFILLISLYLLRKKFAFIMTALSCFILFQVSILYRKYDFSKQKEVIIYADNKMTAVDFIENNRHYVFTTDSARLAKVARSFWLKRQLEEAIPIQTISEYNEGFFIFQNKRFYILTDSLLSSHYTKAKLKVDYLILGRNNLQSMENLERLFDPTTIIIDQTNPSWKTEKLLNECLERDWRCKSMAEKGCLRIKL